MEAEFLGKRRRSLEEDFFRRQDAALLERSRSAQQRASARATLASASRITDPALLDDLVDMGITPETLIALSLVPLIEVAWADDKLEPAEKDAILKAAQQAGLAEDSPGLQLLKNCLAARPSANLKRLWTQYIQSVCASLSATERDSLRAELLERATQVAEAAGSFLGLGSKVSAQEQALLSELSAAFDR